MANAGKPSRIHILFAEGEAESLTAHAGTLQKAGHEVETAVGRKAVEDAVRHSHFDLVVLGPSITKNDRHHLPYMVKKFSAGTRVLVMHTDGERHPYVDANVDTGRSTADVVAKIAALWPKAEVAAAKAAGK